MQYWTVINTCLHCFAAGEYASRAIEALIDITQMSVHSTVADIGAGSGRLTSELVGKARTIYAVEPNRELRQILSRDLGAFPSVAVIDGSAEDTRLPDHCVDVITVVQAIHWFDPEPARREMMRILKEAGWLALIRNNGVNNEQNRAVRSLMTEEHGADLSVVTGRPKEMPTGFFFGNEDFQSFVFPFTLQQGWEEFLGTLTTISFMPDEDHPIFPQLETEARKIFSIYSRDGFWQVEGETELIVGRPSRSQTAA